MKKLFLLLVAIFSLALTFSSCQKEEDLYNRRFVAEAPESLKENRYEAYVDFDNLQKAEFIGSYRTRTSGSSYINENGNIIINYYNVDTDIYKIKARKYWNWLKGYQYISDYTEEYQVTASVLNQIRQELKNKDFVICHKKTVVGEDDYVGLGLLIWAVD